jgi:glyoxylate reductase
MRILYHSRTRKPALEADLGLEYRSLPELLAESDFVTLHTPLTPETRHLIDAAALAAMKPGAILVNTARGQVVDQDALVEALRTGRLGGAALDVTTPEPLPLDHPLSTFPNVIITPHIGSASRATRARMAEMAAANILAVLAGREPPNPVNRPANPRS